MFLKILAYSILALHAAGLMATIYVALSARSLRPLIIMSSVHIFIGDCFSAYNKFVRINNWYCDQ